MMLLCSKCGKWKSCSAQRFAALKAKNTNFEKYECLKCREKKNTIIAGLEIEYNSNSNLMSIAEKIKENFNFKTKENIQFGKEKRFSNVIKSIYHDGSVDAEIVLMPRVWKNGSLKMLTRLLEIVKSEARSFNNASCHHTFVVDRMSEKDSSNDAYARFWNTFKNAIKIFRENYFPLLFLTLKPNRRDLRFAALMRNPGKYGLADITKYDTIATWTHNYPMLLPKIFGIKKKVFAIEYRLPFPIISMKGNIRREVREWREYELAAYEFLFQLARTSAFGEYIYDEATFTKTRDLWKRCFTFDGKKMTFYEKDMLFLKEIVTKFMHFLLKNGANPEWVGKLIARINYKMEKFIKVI